MSVKFESSIDEIGIKILQALQMNARSTFSEIGKRVGLSSPAVAERIYKMEASGIINGYHADIKPDIFGHHILAFISLTTQPEKYQKIYSFAIKEKEIIECHHISGNESLIMKVVSVSIPHLESVVEKLSKFGETKTRIVLSSPINKKVMESI